jgi:hypothetical protein
VFIGSLVEGAKKWIFHIKVDFKIKAAMVVVQRKNPYIQQWLFQRSDKIPASFEKTRQARLKRFIQ